MSRYLLLTMVLLVSLFIPLAPAQAADPPPPEAPLPGEGPWVVRAEYMDRAMVDELAAWLEPWEVHHDAGYLVAEVSYADYVRMVEAGFMVQVDAKQTARLHQQLTPLLGQINRIPGYACYRTVEETYQTALDIVAEHPNLATWIDIGDSWEKQESGGASGYDLMVLRLTNAAISGPKPKLFMMTSMHAREYTPAELGTRFAEYLVDNYGADADVTWLLDYHEIHLLLQANPDGRKRAETGLSWRKNTNNNYCSNTNTRGADLNRNFAFQWGCCGGSSDYECDLTYRGPSAASEPETQAVQVYVRSQFPDQREDDLSTPAPLDATGVFLDIHSYSELILWPWGFTATEAPNGPQLQTLGRKFAYFNGYEPDQSMSLYPTDGTTDGLAYGELGLAAYTFELGTSFFQDCGAFESTILPDNLPALLYAAKVARTPYMTPAGPDALDVTVASAGVVPGDSITLTALLDDARYYDTVGAEPSQAIAAAEYTVDAPPWEAGATSHAMTVQDGGFDETSEAVQAVLDTTGWSVGRHIVYVRGQDAAGNWGAVSAVFVYVLDPATAPLITGRVRDACTNGPLPARVAAGGFRTTVDPATGCYEMHVISGTYDLVVSTPGYITETLPGVVARDEQMVQQDAHLYPAVTETIFSNDVESGEGDWEAEGTWAITTEDAHSPTHAWTDSPGGDYGNSQAVALISPRLDLSDYSDVSLSFWHTYAIEEDYDYGRVQVSSDDGASWTELNSYTGSSNSWKRATLAAPALTRAGQARIRFLLDTDTYVVEDGWYIDDIKLTGARGMCTSPIAPSAAFIADTEVSVGDPVIFTNITTGTVPLTYAWAFGDGVTSTLEAPTHTYAQSGDYTVHLTATNAYGADVTTATVVVRDVFIWTGTAGTDWHAAANWSAAAIPDVVDNVVIPANPSGGHWPVITGSATCRQLTLDPEAVLIVDAGGTLNVETELINQGRLTQRASVDGSEPVDFLGVDAQAGEPRYYGVSIDAEGDMGTVTVTVRGGQGCGAAGTLPDTVQRCYDITPQITQTATITFYYHTNEANGNRKPTAYHYAGGGQWEALTMITCKDDVPPWYLVVAVADAYSPFVLKEDEPAVVGVYGMRGSGGARALLVAGCVLGLALALHVRRKRRG